MRLARRAAAEFVGSALLTTIVIGSGISAARLSTDHGLQLLENALATGLGLFVIIAVLAPLSGAHLNPLITLVDAILGRRGWKDVAAYLPAQIIGCCAGALLANIMFGLPAVSISTTERFDAQRFIGELVATAGLVLVVFALRSRPFVTPVAVAAYITAAYFFTSSTSFANPAITVARMLSDSFAGIAPASVPGFIGAQVVGAGVGVGLVLLLFPRPANASS